MKLNRQLISKFKGQQGVTAVIVAIVIAVLLSFVALAVDIGYVSATKNELQNIADSAALAGAGLLGEIYKNVDPTSAWDYNCLAQDTLGSGFANDCVAIKEQAISVVGTAQKNRAAGKTDMDIDYDDIIIYDLVSNNNTKYDGVDITLRPTAVRVIARRDDTKAGNSPIGTFFAKIFGINSVNLNADATAALTGVGETGEANFPIGLSWTNFVNDCSVDPPVPRGEEFCSQEITLNPTGSSCAGWHNFTGAANPTGMIAKTFEMIVEDTGCDVAPCSQDWLNAHWTGVTGVPFDDPPTVTGDTAYFFTGGTVSDMFTGSYLEWKDDPNNPKVDDYTIPVGVDPTKEVSETNPQNVLGSPKNKPAPFIALFDYFRFRDKDYEDINGNGVFDEGDNKITDNSVWTAIAPVYEDDCPCDNPNKSRTIIGFVTVRVTSPNPPPDSTVTAKVDCNFRVIEGRGGGGLYSYIFGNVPSLVE